MSLLHSTLFTLSLALCFSAFGGDFNDVQVPDTEGKQTSAIKIVSAFITDVAAEAATKNQTTAPTDSDLDMRIRRALIGRGALSVAILVEPGAAPQTITGFVHDIFVAKNPELTDLSEYRFLEINSAALDAGTKFVDVTEMRINAMIELSKRNKIFWLVDKLTNLEGSGPSANNLARLQRSLEDGTVQLIGTATIDLWGTAGAQSLNAFTLITKDPASESETLQILRILAEQYGMTASESALDEIYRLSTHMDSEQAQPAAALDLLKDCEADLRMIGQSGSLNVTDQVVQAAAQASYHMGASPRREPLSNFLTTVSQFQPAQLAL